VSGFTFYYTNNKSAKAQETCNSTSSFLHVSNIDIQIQISLPNYQIIKKINKQKRSRCITFFTSVDFFYFNGCIIKVILVTSIEQRK